MNQKSSPKVLLWIWYRTMSVRTEKIKLKIVATYSIPARSFAETGEKT